jgi:hypothetical protein
MLTGAALHIIALDTGAKKALEVNLELQRRFPVMISRTLPHPSSFNRNFAKAEESMTIPVSSNLPRDSARWKSRHIPKIILNLFEKLLSLKSRNSFFNKLSYQITPVNIMKFLHSLSKILRNPDAHNIRHTIPIAYRCKTRI